MEEFDIFMLIYTLFILNGFDNNHVMNCVV